MKKTGKFIVIEGSDGSGKSTQFALLLDYLQIKGEEVVVYKFPQYEEPSSFFVREYLNGNYGSAEELGAYTPSLFYALDRFHAAQGIREQLNAGKVVLCDRYIGSNMAHQGQKLEDQDERDAYLAWLHNLEYNMLKVPKPDLSIVLLMPADLASELMSQREDKRSYTSAQKDLHEADLSHLKKAVAMYTKLCDIFPNDFTAVNCISKDGSLRTKSDIHQEIRRILA